MRSRSCLTPADRSVEVLEEWGVYLEDDNGRRILRRLASPERMILDTLRRATPAAPVLFAAVNAALEGVLHRETA